MLVDEVALRSQRTDPDPESKSEHLGWVENSQSSQDFFKFWALICGIICRHSEVPAQLYRRDLGGLRAAWNKKASFWTGLVIWRLLYLDMQGKWYT